MTAKKNKNELRKRAEAAIRDKRLNQAEVSPEEFERTLYELHVHQAELEIQNEELRKTQEDLIRSRDEFARLYNSAPVGYVTLDDKGFVLNANQTFAGMVEFSTDKKSKKAFDRFLHPDDRHIFISRYRALFSNPEGKSLEVRLKGEKGKEEFVSLQGSSIIEDHEEPDNQKKYLLLSISDITENKIAEQKLQHQKNLLQTILDGIPDIIGLQKPDHSIVAYNKAGYDRLGKSPDEVVGRKCYEILGQSATCEKCLTNEVVRTGRIQSAERYISEWKRWMDVQTIPVKDEKGKVVLVVEQLRDITERKAMEQEISEAHKIINSGTSVAISWRNEKNWPVEYVSENIKTLLGYTAKDMTSRKFLYEDLIHDEDRDRVSAEVREACKKNRKTFEHKPYRLIAKNGEAKWISDKTSIERNKSGEPVVFRGILQDITAQKSAEDALRLDSLTLSHIQDRVVVTDLNGIITFVNDASSRMLGRSQKELIGRHVSALGEDTALGASQEDIVGKTLKDGDWRGEVVNITKDGNKTILDCRTYVVRDESGQPILLCGISTDITQMKVAERRLQESERKLDSIIRTVPDTIYRLDTEGRITFVNDAVKEYGYTTDELIGRDIFEIVYPPDREKALYRLNERRSGDRRTMSFEIRLLRKDQTFVEFEIKSNAVRELPVLLVDAEGLYDYRDGLKQVFLGTQGVARDISHRKKIEQALLESEQSLRATLDGLSSNIALLDEKGEILLVNQAWRDFAEQNGMPYSKVSEGVNYLEACRNASGEYAGGAAEFAQGIENVLSGKQASFKAEYPCHSPDEKRWFIGRVTSFPGTGPRRAVVAHENITERKLSELALQESEEHFRTFVEKANDIVYSLSPDGVFHYVSPNWRKILGHEVKDVIGKSFEPFVHPDDVESCREFLKDVMLKGEKRSGIEYRVKHKDGSWRWHSSSGAPNYDINGKVLNYIGVARDVTDRIIAENALKSNQQELNAIYQFAPVMMCVLDKDRNVLYTNKAFEEYTGRTQEELISDRACGVLGCFRAKDDPRGCGYGPNCGSCTLRIALDETLKTGIAHRNVEQSTTLIKGNSRKEVVLSASTARIEINGRKCLLFCFEDITEQKKAAESLRAMAEMLDNAPNSITVHDSDGNFLYANQKTFEIHGYRSDEFFKLKVSDIDVPASKNLIKKRIKQILREGEASFEVEHFRKNGSTIPLEVFVKKVDWGNKPAMLSIATDIRDRKEREQERDRLMSAIEQTKDIIMIADSDATIKYVNPSFEEVTGYTSDQAIGGKASILKSGSHGEDYYRDMWQCVSSGKTWQGKFINKKKDGSLYTEVATISPIFDGTGNISSYVAVKRDVTKEIQMEENLRQAQKMESIGRLAGGVAHDFNNMLSVITGHAQLAMNRGSLDEQLEEDLNEIVRAAHRSADIARQLLAFARKQTIAPKVLDLNSKIESIFKMLGRLIGEDIELVWKPWKGLSSIKIDPTQIDQILANLVVNARDAIDGIGKITVETQQVEFGRAYCDLHPGFIPGRFAILAVSDNGCGMDEETQSHLFEPFYTTKETGKGTGLGLATVYGIVKQNNGFINVYSEVNEGTTIKIYFPSHSSSESNKPEPVKDKRDNLKGSETILFVEDEGAILRVSKIILEQMGYKVLAASRPVEALKIAEEYGNTIDLLMTDVVMPEMNGRELAEKITALYPEIRCLYTSGYTANVIAHHGVLEEGVHFLEKPYDVDELARKLREVLD